MTRQTDRKEVVDVMHPSDSRVLHEQRLREQPLPPQGAPHPWPS
jgi:hypothetical protein